MKGANRIRSFALLLASSIRIGSTRAAGDSYLNVYGESLQPCSRSGMALTGYIRDGHCVDRDGDSGSHHVCIDLSSVSSLGDGRNFCQVTGQSDWCSSDDMQCHDDQSSYGCSVENWCVCQWAFASYIDKAGGCDAIQDVMCESINVRTIEAYGKDRAKYGDALACIVERCGLESSAYYSSLLAAGFGGGGVRSGGALVGLGVATALAASAAVAAAFLVVRKRRVEAEVDRVWKGDDMTDEISVGKIN